MFDILIVEDDINTQKLMCAVLKRGGYNPYTAKDGLEHWTGWKRSDLI